MVQYVDYSVVAQLGTPDMRGPIAYGLAWPGRIRSGTASLDFTQMAALTFEPFSSHDHMRRYPGLSLAWRVLAAADSSPAVLNAANEVAVAAFLDGNIRFDQIHQVNLETLDGVTFARPESLDDLIALDLESRSVAQGIARRIRA
jgi:1-deoxy-D-xylulose-5-phosphate reductoisomerase